MDTENILGSEEVWRDIAGFEGLYQISSWGNVRSLPRRGRKERILKPFLSRDGGYLKVDLRKDNIDHKKYIHTLVAEAFIPNSSGYPCINHIDENKLNNRVDNLEWTTFLANNLWGTHLERISQKLRGTGVNRYGTEARKRPIRQLDLDGTYISSYESSAAASVALFGTSSHYRFISDCCRCREKTAYGYRWEFENEIGGPKPVALLDSNNTILQKFSSVRLAAQVLCIPRSSIRACCLGQNKTTHGMCFVYLERGSL